MNKFPEILLFANYFGMIMEINFPLAEMGLKIKSIRKKSKMNQIDFYRFLYPEKQLEEENIKKKMNAIENGKLKRVNLEFLLRVHERFDISIDYLLGYETEYLNYENKAACQYTGLSSKAISQLHALRTYKDRKVPDILPGMSKEQVLDCINEKNRIDDSNWVLYIVSKLLEMKPDDDHNTGIANMSIFYDIYMMSLDAPETIIGIPEEIATRNIPFSEKAVNSIRVAADTISYKDRNNEIHSINVGSLNQQVWKDRLIHDVEKFTTELKKQNKSYE